MVQNFLFKKSPPIEEFEMAKYDQEVVRLYTVAESLASKGGASQRSQQLSKSVPMRCVPLTRRGQCYCMFLKA